MGLYGAMYSAVSSLTANSSALSAISDNVNNTNTVGFKTTDVGFSTLVTSQSSSSVYAAGGVKSVPKANIDAQGLVKPTSRAMDLAIAGKGFFIVNGAKDPASTDEYTYTRAGSFDSDREGNVKNTAGQYLQGWPLLPTDNTVAASELDIDHVKYMRAYKDISGNTKHVNPSLIDNSNLQTLNINSINGTSRPTEKMELQGFNLPNSSPQGTSYSYSASLFDSLGTSATTQLTWTKLKTNEWGVEITPPEGSSHIELCENEGKVYDAAGRLDFVDTPAMGAFMDIKTGTPGHEEDVRIVYGNADIGPISVIDAINHELDPATGKPLPHKPIVPATPAKVYADMNVNQETQNALAMTDFKGEKPDIVITIDITGNAKVGDIVAKTRQQLNTFFTERDIHTEYTPPGTGSSAALKVPTKITGLGWGEHGKTGSWTDMQKSKSSSSLVLRQHTNAPITIDVDHLVSTPSALGGIIPSTPGTISKAESATIQGRRLDKSTVPATVTPYFTIPGLDDYYTTGKATHGIDSATGPTINSGDYQAVVRNDVAGLTFNNTGTPQKFFGYSKAQRSDPHGRIRIEWVNGSADMNGKSSTTDTVPEMELQMGNYERSDGLTQQGTEYGIGAYNQDGFGYGSFKKILIDDSGVVRAQFNNGLLLPVFQIPLATFTDPNHLSGLSGNQWAQSDESGRATLREVGTQGTGKITPSALEQSTSDLGDQFSKMIMVQKSYSASTKIITKVDSILQEVVNMIR